MSSKRAKLVISETENGLLTAELIANNNESILKLGEYSTKETLKRGIKDAKRLFASAIIVDGVVDFKDGEVEVEEFEGEETVLSVEYNEEEAKVEEAMAKEGLVAKTIAALKGNKGKGKQKKK